MEDGAPLPKQGSEEEILKRQESFVNNLATEAKLAASRGDRPYIVGGGGGPYII